VIDLARTIDLPVTPAQAWTALWDVPAVARCLPGLQEIQEISAPGTTRRDEPHRYRATVKDKVGPFSVVITVDVTVNPSEAEHLLRVSATGRAEVGGKLAALGQAVIHRKTRDVLDTFARNLGTMLGSRA
jgi:uncharacterized protein